jgi:hypothetical protein
MGALDTNGYHYSPGWATERQVICDTDTHTADDQRGDARGWTVAAAAAGNERRLEPISSSETNNSDSVL